jgi:hypothetical protein
VTCFLLFNSSGAVDLLTRIEGGSIRDRGDNGKNDTKAANHRWFRSQGYLGKLLDFAASVVRPEHRSGNYYLARLHACHH